ncbi:hypothetical protein SCLCIDRAFT_1044724 [Scleroderma citrinum Foug A]|uniref:Uncharacterized protein n=1 Tax=Scleroderma citrinum Foug A TaxID=1036808 RepID=A0A0C3A2S7_9AGAM|nr:hypothetical protein SCLCIDRAFT_1044724 [Scleroderma citrinum Foug A]
MAKSTKTTAKRPMATRSMTRPVTRASSREGGRRTRSSSANQWDQVILCLKKRSRTVVKRSSTARSASVDGDLSEPPLDVVKSRNGRPGRTLRQGGGDPIKEEHTDTSLLPGSPSSAAGVGERRQRSPPSKLKTLEKRLEGALGEIADLTNLVNDFKSNNAKAQLQYLEEYFTCALYVAVFHSFLLSF